MSTFKNDVVTDLPDISKVEFQRIHKNYLKVILINTFFVFIPVFIGLVFFINKKLNESIPEYITLIYVLFFMVFALIFLYLIVGFKRRKYALREKDLSYKSGVIVKTITTVPFSRIQHVEIDEGPISRYFGLSSLSVYTAGDSSDDLDISGIKKEEALRIKEFISSKINE
ncbi:PH domain-containing protein [Pseudotenacibaculum sp. MALMAid0570]|uniref:PH domain-containing protein n=1 Tax=Pseudotenacibaculum sp. MALMAid0570 TaxID=3143938 RepID=UPI0032DED863